MDEILLSRVEDAGLNASAPPQQRWMDGWLLRLNPGKAKRARCINAVAPGRQSLEQKLTLADAAYRRAGLPMLVRITPFTEPADLDTQLARRRYTRFDDTCVMVCRNFPIAEPRCLPSDTHWATLDAPAYAQAVGALRGSTPGQREAHAERLMLSPVPYRGYAIRRDNDHAVLACGQFAQEAEMIGLYDIYTHPAQRRQGLARVLCERLLSISVKQGATISYLQVEADNAPARHLYTQMGFTEAYRYHYRQAP